MLRFSIWRFFAVSSVFCTFFIISAGETVGEDASRIWTDSLGRKVTANWDLEQEETLRNEQSDASLEYPLPLIREKDGKSFVFPLNKLSDEDRAFVLEEREKHLQDAEDDPFADSPLPTLEPSKPSKASPKTAKTSKASSRKTPLKKPKAGDSWVVKIEDVSFSFRYCPPGILLVPNGTQAGRFPVKEGFWMLETEVTQKQWNAIMGDNPAHFQSDSSRPVEQVNWFDANRFCEKISVDLKTLAFLPSALQWTYASCAGTPILTAEQNILTKAWLKTNSDGKTHAAAQLVPNAWGLFDMYGNVWEWCSECHDARKKPIQSTSPERKETSALHCGGSWYGTSPELGKETWRDADQRIFDVGFRFCVSDEIRIKTVPQEEMNQNNKKDKKEE